MKFLVFVLCSILVTVANGTIGLDGDDPSMYPCTGDGKPCGFYCMRQGLIMDVCDFETGACTCKEREQPKPVAAIIGNELDPEMYPCIGDGKPCGVYCKSLGLITDICDLSTGECTCKPIEQPKPVIGDELDPAMYPCIGDGKPCEAYCMSLGLVTDICDLSTGECTCKPIDAPKAVLASIDLNPECAGDGKGCDFYCAQENRLGRCDFETGDCICYTPEWMQPKPVAASLNGDDPSMYPCIGDGKPCGFYCRRQGLVMDICDFETGECTCKEPEKPRVAKTVSLDGPPSCFGDGKGCGFYCSQQGLHADCDYETGSCFCYKKDMYSAVKANDDVEEAPKCDNGIIGTFKCGVYCQKHGYSFAECHPETRECTCRGKPKHGIKAVSTGLEPVTDPQCFGDGKQCEFYCSDRNMFASCDFESGACTCYSPDEPTTETKTNPGCLGDSKACQTFCLAQDLMAHCDFKTGECQCRVPVA